MAVERARSLEIVCPSVGPATEAVTSWNDTMRKPWDIRVLEDIEGDEAGFLSKCQRGLVEAKADVIAYFHSDLFIHEHGWDERVLEAFADPRVAVVGFVGATGLGHENVYKVPYDYTQLARYDVWSNLSDWSAHGKHESETRPVAVIDSCAVVVRRSFLTGLGGWPVGRYPNTSHCSDLWVCACAARAGHHVELVGIACTHRSGGRGSEGERWLDARGGDQSLHRAAHRVLYEDFRDVLPIRVDSTPEEHP